ncbi:hypothetical protein LXA43DRAFT_986144 [Ganoderma leucocontextum]|nr:hypothetical protein LXA43DRAFT_986144 [Ganoderma leucocontextum]
MSAWIVGVSKTHTTHWHGLGSKSSLGPCLKSRHQRGIPRLRFFVSYLRSTRQCMCPPSVAGRTLPRHCGHNNNSNTATRTEGAASDRCVVPRAHSHHLARPNERSFLPRSHAALPREPRAGVMSLRLRPCLPPRAVMCGSGPQHRASWSLLRRRSRPSGTRRGASTSTSDNWCSPHADSDAANPASPHRSHASGPLKDAVRPLSEQSSRAEKRRGTYTE